MLNDSEASSVSVSYLLGKREIPSLPVRVTNWFIMTSMDYKTYICAMPYTKISKAFNELTVYQLYDLLRLRSEVFVVEQNCVFLDADNKDQKCQHVLIYDGDTLVAGARVVPAGTSYTEVSIGRIISSSLVRGKGVGKILTQYAIDECRRLHGNVPIRIGAQCYAIKFYEQLGFVVDGEVYDEDGIDHVEMILN